MQRRWVVSADYRSAIEAIKAARVSAGITQRELARKLGKPPSFPNKIENLERRLDIVEFVAIARALEIAPGALLAKILAVLPPDLDF
jgi:transcriptional regulator with XRE-family HTH domain